MGVTLKGKLIDSLAVLDSDEWEEFGDFLASPFFNKGKEVEAILSLFNFCKKSKDDFLSESFSKEAAYIHVFSKEEVVKGKLEKLMTRLIGLLHEYMAHKQMREKAGFQHYSTAKFYRERNRLKLAEAELKKWEKGIFALTQFDSDFFWNGYLLNSEYALLNISIRREEKTARFFDSLRSLDLYYILEKLEQACWVYSQKMHRQLEDNVSLKWMEGILDDIKTGPYYKEPSVRIYFLAVHLLREHENSAEGLFHELENEIEKNGHFLTEEKLKFIQTILRIFLVSQYNNGKLYYLPIFFRLYKSHLKNGWLYHEGKIQPEVLMNIVNLGLRVGEVEWVRSTLNNLRNKIWDVSDNEEVFHFNMAQYFFQIKKYKKAEEFLFDNYQNFYYRLAARRMEVKLCYEQNSVLLTSKIEAFKMFIFRLSKKQLPEKLKDLNNNFIDIVRQLIHPKTLGNEKRIEKLKKKITEKEKVAEREWLLEKINEMK